MLKSSVFILPLLAVIAFMKRCVATKAASALPSNTARVERSWPPENATLLKYCFSGIFTTLPPKIDSGISEPEVLAGSTSSITVPFTESRS